MRFFKDHPKEIKAGWVGGDFPPPFRPAVAAAAWPPKAQDVKEPQPSSGGEDEEADDDDEEEEEKKDEEDDYVSTLSPYPAYPLDRLFLLVWNCLCLMFALCGDA